MGEGWVEECRKGWEKVGLKKVEENGRRLDYRREKRMGEGWIIEGRRE